MTPEKAMFARSSSEAGQLKPLENDLRKAVQQLRPTALIGAAAVRGAFSQKVLSQLSQVGGEMFLNCLCIVAAKPVWKLSS